MEGTKLPRGGITTPLWPNREHCLCFRMFALTVHLFCHTFSPRHTHGLLCHLSQFSAQNSPFIEDFFY